MDWAVDHKSNRLFVRISEDSTPEDRLKEWRRILKAWEPGGTAIVSAVGTVLPMDLMGIDEIGQIAQGLKIQKMAFVGGDAASQNYMSVVVKVFNLYNLRVKQFVTEQSQEMFDWLNAEEIDHANPQKPKPNIKDR